jgi:hypothetical protein
MNKPEFPLIENAAVGGEGEKILSSSGAEAGPVGSPDDGLYPTSNQHSSGREPGWFRC